MLRHSSSGNNRYRGMIPKDALHISLILAFTIWILYHLTYTYDTNAIVDGYMQVIARQQYKMVQESRDIERKIVDTMHEDRDDSEEGEIEKRIKENEARERSFKDDDASSAVLHDNQITGIKEELPSEIATEFDIILGNGTINQTDVQKNISHLGSFSEKSDEIEDVDKNENVLLVNLNETYVHGEEATDKQNRIKK
ncbi:hypothetical protein FCM35_KLT04341 [Carex littledalei]|uniref:Uncharacterized protein n=1 Tax=Carex littledalei TaxID=544730 RepID=A0A833VAJ0_9POAL|nr:hypothetical protein FCM35_KLT04341 [Carex littledalei]